MQLTPVAAFITDLTNIYKILFHQRTFLKRLKPDIGETAVSNITY